MKLANKTNERDEQDSIEFQWDKFETFIIDEDNDKFCCLRGIVLNDSHYFEATKIFPSFVIFKSSIMTDLD